MLQLHVYMEQAAKLVKNFYKTDFGIALIITLIWKIVLLAVGYFIDASNGGALSLIDHTVRWDSGWYLAIVEGHYTNITASAAFYPLFPFLVYVVHFISFGIVDYPVAAQFINTIAVWFALTAAIKLGRSILGQKSRFWIAVLLLSAPAAFFMHTFYSEAIFVALSFWAYYFALKKNWMGVGILLAILTSSRLPSILIVALCGLEYLRSYDWNIKKSLNKKILWFLLAPLGFIAFSIYLGFAQHDFLGMFHAYKATHDWDYQVFNPNIFETIWVAAFQLARGAVGIRPVNAEFVTNALLPALSLLFLGLGSLYFALKHRQKYLPLAIVGILSIIMFTVNSNVVSVHRYVLPSLTIYVAALLFFTKKRRIYLYVACFLGVLAQILLYSNFVQNVFAG